MTISQEAFWNLPQVKACQETQKRNRFYSKAHRAAYVIILNLAKKHGVDQHFDTIEQYDKR